MIAPSSPMLITPARSVTRLAERGERERRGGADGRLEEGADAASLIGGPSRRRLPAGRRGRARQVGTRVAQPVGGDDEQDQHRLDDRDDDGRDPGIALHGAGAGLERAEQDAGRDDRRAGASRASSATAMAV